ncbi:MAG: glycosyltransferase [Candidatus Omnitrophica bacterium]|nr:glycosyltransferase [Candidatus Omnitrophota bacterium]MBU1925754.1 glycosyltransferase [Candidatus Omnitrophota bacterium]
MALNNNEQTPFISIVIPTYNRAALLCECIKSVMRLEYPKDAFEIIVVDDGSTDGSEECLERMLPESRGKIKYLREITNRGVAAARNRGFAAAKGEIIACLDDDCRAQKDWLKNIIATLALYPDAAAVGGSVINATESPLAWASYIIEFSSWFPVGGTKRVKDIPGCNIAYRKKDIAGNRFPEEFKGSVGEDTLFNYNLINKGKVIIFNPKIKVFHCKWGYDFTKEDFYKTQKKYALSFVRGGYKIFGTWGNIFMKYRVLNLFCLRIILVFLRCLRSKKYLLEFVRNFKLILLGEWRRNKLIYEYSAVVSQREVTSLRGL